jgi:TubC N-terminal docking domain
VTAEDILAVCRTEGIMLEVVEDRLRCRAPKGVLTPELQWAISINKTALLDALRRESQEERLSIMAADEVRLSPAGPHESLEVGSMCRRCRDEGWISHLYVKRDGCLWCLQCLRRGVAG